MKKSFVLKTAKILVILILTCFILTNVAQAGAFSVKGAFDGKISSSANAMEKPIKTIMVDILTIVRIIGMAVAIIMLIVIGIKIMLASPSEKAAIKQYSMNYVIGAVVLLGASAIVTMIQKAIMSAFGS